MNKKEKIKSLTWNYFWGLKIKELMWLLVIVGGIMLIPFAFGMMHCSINPDIQWEILESGPGDDVNCSSFGHVYFLGFFITIVNFIIIVFVWWLIELNWYKAEDMANEEYAKK